MTHFSTSTNEKDLTLSLLESNLRLDGRAPMKERITSTQFLKKRGHLVYKQGNTSVLAKSFIELSSPKDERPSEGFIMFKVDCQCCQDTYDQNKKLSVQIAKLLEKNIVGSSCLDPESLCIVTGKYVWKLTVELSIIQDDGNVVDCVLNGAVKALMDMRKPFVNVDKNQIQIKNEKLQQLSIAHLPISMTFFFIENNIFTDATKLEESVSLTRVTITMNIYKEICSIHKPGGMGLDQATISGAIKVLEDQVKQKTQSVRQCLKKRCFDW